MREPFIPDTPTLKWIFQATNEMSGIDLLLRQEPPRLDAEPEDRWFFVGNQSQKALPNYLGSFMPRSFGMSSALTVLSFWSGLYGCEYFMDEDSVTVPSLIVTTGHITNSNPLFKGARDISGKELMEPLERICRTYDIGLKVYGP